MSTIINTGTVTYDSRYNYTEVPRCPTSTSLALPIGREGFLTSAGSDDRSYSTCKVQVLYITISWSPGGQKPTQIVPQYNAATPPSTCLPVFRSFKFRHTVRCRALEFLRPSFQLPSSRSLSQSPVVPVTISLSLEVATVPMYSRAITGRPGLGTISYLLITRGLYHSTGITVAIMMQVFGSPVA